MKKNICILLLILFIGALLRLYNFNWDSSHHLQPDERFLTMVTQSLAWPDPWYQYFDTNSSKLNPHNVGRHYFVYGNLPLLIVKSVADLIKMTDYNSITIVGRFISTLFDLGTIFLVFVIARRIKPKSAAPLLAAFTYASAVLPIQLSHYYAVDTFLVFFLTLATFLLVVLNSTSDFKKEIIITSLLGVTFALAISCKISSLYLSPTLIFCALIKISKTPREPKKLILTAACFFLYLVISLKLFQPYLFSSALSFFPNPKVIANWKELSRLYDINAYLKDNISGIFPPAVQFLTTPKYIFPFVNLFFLGLGVPLVSILLLALVASIFSILKNKEQLKSNYTLLIFWILNLFAVQGGQNMLYLRYFLPFIPQIAIVVSIFFVSLIINKKGFTSFVYCYLVAVCIWPLAFLSIYTKPHTRLEASQWIYDNVKSGSKISYEHWDDSLPLKLANRKPSEFTLVKMQMYDKESPQKYEKIYSQLAELDYLVLSSNRVYASTMAVPERYPINNKFYSDLFSGKLGFTKVAQFTSRPKLWIPGVSICLTPPFSDYGEVAKQLQECDSNGIYLVDDYMDESFTVYDHPKVLIFKKSQF